ncbi:MAG: hypothetical protein ABIN67_14320 [Ferruginibacter sp.]
MAIVKSKSGKRLLKRLLITAGIICIIPLLLHLWFVNNARSVLKNYISEQSGGKIKLELSQLDLNLWTNTLQVHKADLVSTDSLNEPITYHVTFNRLSLKIASVWPLLFQKKLLLDSIKLYGPAIHIIQWRKDSAQVLVKDELSIPQEMGKMYKSLISALNKFGIRRIIIDNASISLINKINPDSAPVTVSKIFLDLARFPTRIGKKDVYLKGDQAVELKISDQNITLPGGRHRLSFKAFHLQLFKGRIDLDSCTITAIGTDSLKSNYRIFFKKLSLTGVDYVAMSVKNVIKADSVFCENPFFDFNLYPTDAVKKKTELPDAKKIISDLAGNLDLAFVGVKNAGVHFNIFGKTNGSFFNSNKDNFEIQDFRLNPDSTEPFSIGRFDLTLRDYRLYNEDSSSTMSFDSLNFLNRGIVLNNFALLSKPGRYLNRDNVDIKVPYFEISELNWYQLFFNQAMVAKGAVLKNPIINYIPGKALRSGKKVNMFTALQNIDSLVALDNVTVINGAVNMQLGRATSFNVQNIDFKILSNKLLRSTNKEGVRNSIEQLSFSNAVLRSKDITARLHNVRLTGNNLMYADKVVITGSGDKIAATVNGVYINNLQLDDNADTIEVDGIRWKNADLKLQALAAGNTGRNGNSSSIHLKNIDGNNTQFYYDNGPIHISTFVQTINASSLLKGKGLLQVKGFIMSGNNLVVNSNQLKINAGAYNLSGSDPSSLSGVEVRQVKGRDSLTIRAPLVNYTASLNDLFANNIHLTNVSATDPVIISSKRDTAAAVMDTTARQSPIRIDKLTAIKPAITIFAYLNDSVSILNIPASDKSLVQASDILLNLEGMQIGSLLINTESATYVKPSGQILGVEQGKIDMDLSNILLSKKDGKMTWSGSINNLLLENAKGLGMGKTKNNLRFQQASIGNLNLSSGYLPDFDKLMKGNVSAWLRIPHGEFVDSNTTFKWFNANYANSSKTLTLDSFIYHPTQPLDSVLAHAPYQLDYITVKTGAINIKGLDLVQYEKDKSIIANIIKITNPVLTVYRDKKPPSSSSRKPAPLPVNMIKNIALPVSVKSIQLENGFITYGEKSKKSRKTGNLFFTNISGGLDNIKNSDLLSDDSLLLTFNARFMDSIDIRFRLKQSYLDSLSGFLMTATTKSADLSVLNPFLVPFENVKITSGIVDSTLFSAVGREDIALGEMDIHYRKLRIKFIKDGDPDKSTFVQKVVSFIANTFVIKNNNTNRKGIIFYKHSGSQSFVNYIVQITLSGISTSAGAKKNRKVLKAYKKELQKSGLREITL